MSVQGQIEAAAGAGDGPVGRESELAELIGAFNDVTSRLQVAHESLKSEVSRLRRELREANEQLDRSRRLAALGEMAAGIAHEVRNPLGSIGLYGRMLQEDLADRPEQRRVSEKILKAVRGLDAIVTDVLTFAREIRVRPERVAAGDLIAHAVEESLAGLESRGSVRTVGPDASGAGVNVNCDPTLTHRALVNVIRNAAQAMLERPEVEAVLTLSVRRRVLRRGDGSSRPAVAISVRDSGPGVPAEVMGRIFNPFFTTRAAGTGLGLAIVHRIMDAHDGRVSLRNHAEGGAVVELMFPAAGPEARADSHDREVAE